MKKIFITSILATLIFANKAHSISVDVELALLTDVSSSMSNSEWEIQRDGYVSAFKSPLLHQAISQLPNGLAVAYMEFASTADIPYLSGFSAPGVGWTKITNAFEANDFADRISNLSRVFRGGTTSITGGINFAAQSILNNQFEGSRKLIDISGDGKDNVEIGGGVIQLGDSQGFIRTGEQTRLVANQAISSGITQINGLPFDTLLTDGNDVSIWYGEYVNAGSGSFILPAATIEDLKDATLIKIVSEISGSNPVPDSGFTLFLFSFGLFSLVFVKRFI